MEAIAISPTEKPANGLAGLKYWRQDIVAGLLVSLISLPFSLGIAVASGAPPICGLISAIIAGLLLPFLGGSFVTISGPAAGLAPVLYAAMLALGKGDLAVGYPLLLCAIAFCGCVQIVLSLLKAAKFSAIFPSTVVEAMLASIGLLIIVKQLPFFLGVKFDAHDFFPYLMEAPRRIRQLEPKVLGLGIFCLALIFWLSSAKARWLKVVPPQVVAVLVAIVLGRLLGLSGKQLIEIPDSPFKHGLVFPNFAGLFADSTLLMPLIVAVITLTLVDGVESLATASAVDRIDPYRRKSDPNRVLLAMGISNICSSLAGGLTIIPGGVKSKACIEGGGKTLWANFYNACFLIIFLFVAKPLINLIPYASLAAVLIFTGYKLCKPSIWRHIAHVGREQIILFTLTVLVTLQTDLLIGIIVGIVAKLLMSLMLASRFVQGRDAGPIPDGGGGMTRPSAGVLGLFRNPVLRVDHSGNACHLYFDRPLVCFNSLAVDNALSRIPEGASRVVLHLTDRVSLIDHTTCDNLYQFASDFRLSGRGEVEIEGLERMQPCSHNRSALRLAPTALPPDPGSGLKSLTRMGLRLGEPRRTPEHSLAHPGKAGPNAPAPDAAAPLGVGVSWTVRISRSRFSPLREPLHDAPERSPGRYRPAVGDPTPRGDVQFSVWRMPAPRLDGSAPSGDIKPRRVM